MFISIITINRNNLTGLKKTAQSVLSQNNQAFEWVIVDGASNDGSAEFVNGINRPNTIVISEPDTGIYNAMNKGTRLAHGEYCLYLNSGDALHEENITDFLLKSCETNEYDILRGTMLNIYARQKKEIVFPAKVVTIELLFHGAISHCSTLIRRSLLLKYPYDEHFRIISDLHFFRQAYLYENDLRDFALDRRIVVTDFDMSGISTAQSNLCGKEAIESGRLLLGNRLNEEFTSFIYGKGFFDSILCRMRWNHFWHIAIYVWCFPLIVLFKMMQFIWHFPYIIKHLFRNKQESRFH